MLLKCNQSNTDMYSSLGKCYHPTLFRSLSLSLSLSSFLSIFPSSTYPIPKGGGV